MTDSIGNLTGKRVRINNHPNDEFIGLVGTVTRWRGYGQWDIEIYLNVEFTVPEEWLDIIEEDSMIGKRVIVIGKTTGVILDSKQVDGRFCIRLDSDYREVVWEHPRNFVLEDDITSVIGRKVCIFIDEDHLIAGIPSDAYYSQKEERFVITLTSGRRLDIDSLENLEIIDEDNTTDLIGKQVVYNGKKGVVVEESGDTLFVEFDDYSSYFSKDKVTVVGDVVWKSPQDSLTELQKLCTTNNIHILVSKNDYQIWDEYSDDTYTMNNVDDVMKAIECLNELKKWRQ